MAPGKDVVLVVSVVSLGEKLLLYYKMFTAFLDAPPNAFKET